MSTRVFLPSMAGSLHLIVGRILTVCQPAQRLTLKYLLCLSSFTKLVEDYRIFDARARRRAVWLLLFPSCRVSVCLICFPHDFENLPFQCKLYIKNESIVKALLKNRCLSSLLYRSFGMFRFG